jgi:hypothetical protein
MPGEEHNGQRNVSFVQFALKVETALAGQPDIEHYTSGTFGPLCEQKLPCRFKQSNAQPDGLEEIV